MVTTRLQKCITAGADISCNSNCALYIAADTGMIAIVESLINRGANVLVLTKISACPLHAASTQGHLVIVDRLIGAGADVNASATRADYVDYIDYGGHGSALHEALSNRRDAVAKKLISSGADVNQRSRSDHTPLQIAADLELTEMVDVLLKTGAHVNTITSGHGTALIAVSYNGNTTSLEKQLVAGADVNVSVPHDPAEDDSTTDFSSCIFCKET